MKWLSVMVMAAALAEPPRMPAELAPYLKVSLTARVAGIIEKVEVDRGSLVREGDVVAELSAPELAAQIAAAEARALAADAQKAEAEARLEAAASTWERLKAAAAATPGSVAANDVVQAEKAVSALRASIAAAARSAAAIRAEGASLKAMAEYLTVRAPFAGVVTARMAHPGALASPATGGIVEIEQVSRLRLTVMAPEGEWRRARRGAPVEFTVAAYPGRVFKAVVARTAGRLETGTRALAVEADVDNQSGLLAPGMYAEAWFSAK